MTSPELRPRFEAVVREYAADLLRFAAFLARDRRLAEDVVQDALLRGWRSFASLQDPGAVKSWLFAIVRNECFRSLGVQASRGEEVDIDELELADESSNPANPFGLEMHEALRALPVSYRDPLSLQVLGGFSCAEIASMLGTSEGAVMTRLTRARQALKRLIAPQVDDRRRGVGR